MNKPWPWHTERGWYHSCDYNYYATNFHKDMFLCNLNIEEDAQHKAVRSGQPHDPIIDQCGQYWDVAKTNIMIWPHRYNADKQPEIVEDLVSSILGETIITQKMNLSKDQYYQTLGKCSVMFSCSLHENLGISMMEGVLAGVIPVVPDRCSYKEMYMDEFKYPAEWTESVDAYKQHREDLVDFINERIINRDQYMNALVRQKNILVQNYLNASVMIDKLLKNI
jgi:hypothetical protein